MSNRNFVIFIAALLLGLLKADEFDYEHQGKWYDTFKECGMQSQSPIELITDQAQVSYVMPAISFELYDTPYTAPAKCENNGHTINIQLPKPKGYVGSLWQIYDKLSPHITGGPIPATARYIAESLHFQWGSRDTHGSEHVIDSERFALEMHIVHRNSNYSTVEEAREHPDGLAVIAVLFKVEETVNNEFKGLNQIVTALEKLKNFNEFIEISNLTLADFLSNLDTKEFFTYAGSLTTPPCSQAVTWLVFSHTIKLTHAQMSRFHHISDAHNSVMENNYRSLQAKGNRKVYLRKILRERAIQAPTDALKVPESENIA